MHIKHNDAIRNCQKEPRTRFFGHFIEFGWFHQSGIAYSDRGNGSLATDGNQCSGNLLYYA